MSEDDLQALRERTETGSRLEEDEEGGPDISDRIVAEIEAVEAGDRPKTVAVRDRPVAAFLAALDAEGDLGAVGEALESRLDREPSGEYDRSEVLRLAVRVGLQEATPEYLEELIDAQVEYERRTF